MLLLPETYLQKIGRRVRELREKNKLSQLELAKKVDISRPYLSEIESGKRNPSFQVMSRISSVLVDKDFWIEEELTE